MLVDLLCLKINFIIFCIFQLSELADSRAHNRGQKETRTSEQLISSTEVGASYGPPSNEVTISHRSPNINFLRTSSPQIKTQHNETNKAPLNHHYEHNVSICKTCFEFVNMYKQLKLYLQKQVLKNLAM